MSSTQHLVAAGGLTLAFLGLVAAPAAAANWEITGGTLTVSPGGSGSPIVVDLSGDDPSECPSDPATIDVSFDSPSSGDITVAFSASANFEAPNGDWFRASISSAGSGTYTGSPPSAFDLTMVNVLVVFDSINDPDGPDPCEVDEEFVCAWTIQEIAFEGTYSGTNPPSSGSQVTDMDTTSSDTIAVPFCDPTVLASFGGGTVAVDDVTAEYT